ncbi:MAG: DNA alkylation repair protein [Candidatus Kerfeldbacteria bacterium]|nr:DNA alkylation repair protein [Candidatus Kerfeldbacteria bacterium]
MSTHRDVRRALANYANPTKAKSSAWFFKTGKGHYGEGDKFLGVTVPEQRIVARQFRDLSLPDIQTFLDSPYHEHRLTAVIILVLQYQVADDKQKEKITRFYLANAKRVNNWDMVDSSAPHILGDFLLKRPRTVLYRLSKSKNLWERRISIIATQAFIRHGEFDDTLKIAKALLADPHDLIHKAVGWMLREVGDRDKKMERSFLTRHAYHMPRTMLRYAIEKFPKQERGMFLARKQPRL